MQAINPSLRRDRLSKTLLAALVPFLFALALLLAAPAPGQAMPPDPINDPTPRPPTTPYPVPTNGFNWSMEQRFGNMKYEMVDYHWNETTQTYTDFVRATTFNVDFDGCRSWTDEENGTSALTYVWTFDGQATTTHDCIIRHQFAEGPHTVSVRITGGTTPLGPFTQTVVVNDLLIVSLGDSSASGEGSPDWPQGFNKDIFGNRVSAIPARWQSERCHRSAKAGAAEAAWQIERADPHTSVTFMSFACSGATINTDFSTDPSLTFQPYRTGAPLAGSGILGAYVGAVPPPAGSSQPPMLPSQVQQLRTAITRADGSQRQVDALIITAGGNDMGFGKIAGLCVIFDDCQTYQVDTGPNTPLKTLDQRVREDVAALPGRYDALAADLRSIPMAPNGKVYITEYQDATTNDQGGWCSEMLTDVIPSNREMDFQAAGALFGATRTIHAPFSVMNNNAGNNEVMWAAGVSVMLNNAVYDAAQRHAADRWVLVDGIADSKGNLFRGHGSCATDHWVRRATESVELQGPWTSNGTTNSMPNTMQTRGTFHPTEAGYQAIASRIYAKIKPNLLPTAP